MDDVQDGVQKEATKVPEEKTKSGRLARLCGDILTFSEMALECVPKLRALLAVIKTMRSIDESRKERE